jgi:S1-C subfamily serine protease
MDWENYVVKLNVKSKTIDFNHPLNIYETQESSGTGFFISQNQILTCYHVISGAINIDILFKQTEVINGKIKYIFPDDDLAIVETNNIIPDAKILDHKLIDGKLSGDVFTIGFPFSSTNIKITKGIISGYQESLIQTDASLNHGNSGGPLVFFDESNGNYKVIGINVSKLKGDAEKTGFVVPIYRFHITKESLPVESKIIKKPCLHWDFQTMEQTKLRENIFGKKIGEFPVKTGIRICFMNQNYFSKRMIQISVNLTLILLSRKTR